MSAALFIFGFLALIVGGLLIWGQISSKAKAQQLKTVQHRKIAELKEMAKEVGGDLGPGSYNEFVGVRGDVECRSPLRAELSGTECIYYRMKVDREYQEEYEEYDSQRNQHVRKTRTATETIASNTRHCPFYLHDDTGKIEVLPDGASIDAEKVLSSFEPENRMMSGNMLSYGNFSFSMGGYGGFGPGRRTLGYRLEEYVLPLGRSVYVMGEASDAEGKVVIHKPSKKSNKFVISTKSKEALVQSTQQSALFFLIGAIISFVAGAGLLLGGLISLFV